MIDMVSRIFRSDIMETVIREFNNILAGTNKIGYKDARIIANGLCESISKSFNDYGKSIFEIIGDETYFNIVFVDDFSNDLLNRISHRLYYPGFVISNDIQKRQNNE